MPLLPKHKIISLLFLMLVGCAFGQNKKSFITSESSLLKIDSLYRTLNHFETVSLSLSSDKKIQLCNSFINSTPRHCGGNMSSFMIYTLKLSDTSSIKKYCQEIDVNYLTVLSIFNMLVNEKLEGIKFVKEDSKDCGTLIYINKRNLYALRPKNDVCKNLQDCYWSLKLNKHNKAKRKIKIQNLSQRLLLLTIKGWPTRSTIL
jgi:hypothetical protein